MTGLTARQAGCLQALRDLTFDGVPPSIAELAAELQTGPGRVHELLHGLKDRGKITWIPRAARSIVILDDHVSPAVLNALPDAELRRLAAHVAGILAQRGGGLPRSDRLPEHRRPDPEAREGGLT